MHIIQFILNGCSLTNSDLVLELSRRSGLDASIARLGALSLDPVIATVCNKVFNATCFILSKFVPKHARRIGTNIEYWLSGGHSVQVI